jgi:hypothetical protein
VAALPRLVENAVGGDIFHFGLLSCFSYIFQADRVVGGPVSLKKPTIRRSALGLKWATKHFTTNCFYTIRIRPKQNFGNVADKIFKEFAWQ